MRFRRRPRLPRGGVAERLREANGRLYGWTVRDDGVPLNRLIDEAVEEIEWLRHVLEEIARVLGQDPQNTPGARAMALQALAPVTPAPSADGGGVNEAEIRAWADRVCLDPRYTDEATDEEAERVTELLSIIDWQRKQLTRAQETITDLKRWRPKQ